MVGLVAGLNGAGVIVGDIHQHAAGLHQLQHFLVDQEILALLGPLDAVEHHVGLRQDGGDGLLGAEHGVDLILVLVAQHLQNANINVHNGHISTQCVQHRQCALTDDTAAHDQHVHAGCAGKAANELTLTAVDGQHGFQAEQCALLTGSFAVGRAVAVAVLCGDGDALAVQDGLHFLGVAGGVDAAVDHLAFPQILILGCLDLLDLCQEIALRPHFFGGIYQDSTGFLVSLVCKAAAQAGTLLHQNLMTCCHDGRNFHRGADDPVFTYFNIFQYTKNHFLFLLSVIINCQIHIRRNLRRTPLWHRIQ